MEGTASLQPPGAAPSRRLARAFAAAVLVVGLALLAAMVSSGSTQSRIVYLTAVFLGFGNPVWNLYLLAALGPLYLMEPGQNHVLLTVDALALGAILGEARRVLVFGPSADRRGMPDRWGIWPPLAAAWLALAAGASVPGLLQAIVGWEDWGGMTPVGWIARMTLWGNPETVEWPIRALLNAGLGVGLAAVAARCATNPVPARVAKFGGLGLGLACALSLLNHVGLAPLAELRPDNLDARQLGRLQGVASHPAFLGQWIVLFWAGLLLWWKGSGRVRQALIVVGLAVTALACLLALGRAAWLGVAVPAAIAATIVLRRRGLPHLRLMGFAAIGAAGVAIAVLLLGGDALAMRLARLLDMGERLRLFRSAAILVREHPLGVGLGMHPAVYGASFTPLSGFYESRPLEAISTWVNWLVELGPAGVIGGALGTALLAVGSLRAWRLQSGEDRLTSAALLLGLSGILICSLFQNVQLARSVDYAIWLLVGLQVGRIRRAMPAIACGRGGRTALLTAGGLVALGLALFHAFAGFHVSKPSRWQPAVPGVSPWTNAARGPLRFYVGGHVTSIDLAVTRNHAAGVLSVHSPGGNVVRDHPIAAGETVRLAVQPGGAGWIEVSCSPVVTPPRRAPGQLRAGPHAARVAIEDWNPH